MWLPTSPSGVSIIVACLEQEALQGGNRAKSQSIHSITQGKSLWHLELSCSSPCENKMATKNHGGMRMQARGDAAAPVAANKPGSPAPSVTFADCHCALSSAVHTTLPCKFRISWFNVASMSARQMLCKPHAHTSLTPPIPTCTWFRH